MCPVSSLVQEPPEYHVLNEGSPEVYCSPGHAIADTSNDLIGYLIDGGVGTVSCRFIEASGHWNSTGIRRLRVVTRSRQTMQTASHSSATAAGHRAASCIGLPSGYRPFM